MPARWTPTGNRLFDKPLPQDEAQPRDLFTHLQEHGDVLMVVDQPNTIGALPIAVARDVGCAVAYLPGLAMRKAANLYPDRSKTDARDAFIIANSARTMPHTLRTIDRDSGVLSALTVLAGFDEDLAHETTRALNRIRSLLTQIQPADPEVLVDRIFTAFSEQTVVVPATAAVELVISRVAGQVKELKEQRATVAGEVEAILEDFSLAGVLMSMPGIGIKTPPGSSWPSAMAPHSRPQAISQPTPASRRSREDQGPRSGASSPPDPATNA